MHYEQVIDGCLAGSIGEYGLTDEELAPLLEDANRAIRALSQGKIHGAKDILELPGRRDDVENFGPIAEELRSQFEVVVVLGIGGSSLGGRAIAQLKSFGDSPTSHDGTELRFIDNLDPASMSLFLDKIDFARTAFLVISKSGTTAETMAQYLVCFEAAEKVLGDDASARFVVITEPGDNVLRQLAVERGHTVLDHDPGVGGRFSVLSTVGLLPAAICGLDVAAVRTGALAVLERVFHATASDPCPPAMGAAVSLGLARHRGATMTVLMPYGDSLQPLADWYCQLWAESLGKEGQGTTPIRALGPVDQHSQLQLYLDGPRDKMFTIIQSRIKGAGPTIPLAQDQDAGLGYLSGTTIGDLIAAQQRATTETLIRRGRPTRVIRLPRLDEAAMGALFMHFMLETIVAAQMLGVNAFDQPAVDGGKLLARQFLGRQEAQVD